MEVDDQQLIQFLVKGWQSLTAPVGLSSLAASSDIYPKRFSVALLGSVQ
jgi:hypothetical protein